MARIHASFGGIIIAHAFSVIDVATDEVPQGQNISLNNNYICYLNAQQHSISPLMKF